ncbi:hypothetical protein ACFSUD_03130 [Sulfitobacter aestuarii]|uniref:Uncharacterized protein n=1 Tax=Sulfitobacter aestuarii TaxID=2161676 RepID=A0ABW5TZ65_9RHOB
MSAPRTNIEKQERDHKPSLLGIRGAMIFGALMLLGVFFYVIINGGDEDADAVINTDQASEPEASVPAVDPVEPGTNQSQTNDPSSIDVDDNN